MKSKPLSAAALSSIDAVSVSVPMPAILDLPEKVLQFGTGSLLRGLCDYFIDRANRKGIFNGRVLVVKSTDSKGLDHFDRQDGLYTICVRGVRGNQQISDNIISAAISRVVSAADAWQQVLDAAANLQLKIIVSNTTEVGIVLVEEKIGSGKAPSSFPGKLLEWLYTRFTVCNGDPASGMIIIPTELIKDNGDALQSILVKLAAFNRLGLPFLQWLDKHNQFCNSLVDRIVPGKPEAGAKAALEEELGYTDELMIVAEAYHLWAIEGDETVSAALSFAAVGEGVVISSNIEKFRELKLRLLNGTHSFICGMSYLKGFTTVYEVMNDTGMRKFISDLVFEELVPAMISEEITEGEAVTFGKKVLDRFANPGIQHRLLDICLQYTTKMGFRNVPLIINYIERTGKIPGKMVKGFASYLLFMKGVQGPDGNFYGEGPGGPYRINDNKAPVLAARWANNNTGSLVQAVLSDWALWGTRLDQYNGLADAVAASLDGMYKR